MTQDCLLSIIVPTYNYADRLPRCLGSVLPQLTEECELIVVDDGSTDDTDKLIRELLAGGGPSFRHARQDNAGAGAARNHGLRLSRAVYVLFLDADDELMPETVTKVCAYLKQHPQVDMLLGGHIGRHPDGREKTSLPRRPEGDITRRIEDYLLRKRINIGHGSMVARRSLLAPRPYPVHLRKREDIPVFAHLLAHAEIACLDHVMVRVHKHAASLRRRSEQENYQAFVDEVFRTLPAACLPLKKRYAAQRCLSLSRAALGAGEHDTARRLFGQALRLDWRQALSWSHLRKTVRTWLLGRK